MKIGSGNWTRYFASVLRVLAFTLAICATGGAWATAPEPVAVWDSDFSELAKTKNSVTYTLDLNNNKLSGDNSTITITNTVGVKVNFSAAMTSGMTVMFKYSNLDLSASAGRTLATSSITSNGSDDRTGVYLKSGTATPEGIWADSSDYHSGGTLTDMTSSQKAGVLAFSYFKVTNGTTLYYVANGSRSVIFNCANLGSKNDGNVYGCTVGGNRSTASNRKGGPCTNMKISGIAIFNGVLTESQMTEYEWPNGDGSITIPVTEDTSISALNTSIAEVSASKITLSVTSGVKINADTAFVSSVPVEIVSDGSITFTAEYQRDVSYFSAVDLSGVKGAILRSWLENPGVVGYNFRSAAGSDTSVALASGGTWLPTATEDLASGSTTAIFADGLSTLEWSSANTYTINSGTMLNGYLDDGGSQATISLSNVPYETYDVIVYAATDSEDYNFRPVTVNGTSYTWSEESGEAVSGSSDWGISRQPLAAYGKNALRVKNLSGPLKIKGGNNNGSARGGIAAVQIMPTTTLDVEVKDYTLTLDGTAKNWTAGAWMSGGVAVSAPTSARNVEIVASASTALTLDAAVKVAQLTIRGEGASVVTISNGSGGSLSVGEVVVTSGILKPSGTPTTSMKLRVLDGGAIDLADADVSGYYVKIAGQGVLKDGKYTGALFSSKEITSDAAQLRGITLTANATIRCDYNWGIIRSQWNEAVLGLNSYTLTKVGAQNFWICNVTKNVGTGNIIVNEGNFAPIHTKCKFENATLTIKSGATLRMDTSDGGGATDLEVKNLVCETGSTVNIAAGRTLTVTSALTANGTMTPLGTVTCNGDMTIGGTVTVPSGKTWTVGGVLTQNAGTLNVTGTLKLTKTATLVFTGATIATGATCNVSGTWDSKASPNHRMALNGNMVVAGTYKSQGDVQVGTTGRLFVTGTGALAAYWDIGNSGIVTITDVSNLPTYDGGSTGQYITKVTNKATGKVVFVPTDSSVGSDIGVFETHVDTTSGSVEVDVSSLTLPTGTSKKTLFTTSTALDLSKFSVKGNADYYLQQNAQDAGTDPGALTLQLYAAKDSAGDRYTTTSAAIAAITASNYVTILNGTEASIEVPEGKVRVGTDIFIPAAEVRDAEDVLVSSHPTLAAAVTAAANGQKVAMLADSNEDITLNEKTITLDEGSYTFTGTFTGNGAVRLYQTLFKSPSSNLWDEGWTGTVIIDGYNNNGVAYYDVTSGHDVPFHLYGNANSKIKAPGLMGYAYMDDSGEEVLRCESEIVIDPDTNFEFWDGKSDTGIKFRKLSGSGTLRLDGNLPRTTQYIFEDVKDFAGNVDITDPGFGKKSFIFGPQANAIIGSMYPANLVIATNVTVAANKTWDIPAGIIINEGNTLTLNDGAKISLISERSEGKLVVADNATASVLAPDRNPVYKTTLKTALEIGSEATLCVSNTAIRELTIPADAGVTYTNNGTLDFSKCSSLETLHLTLGASKTVDFGKILLPASCTNVVYDIGSVRDLTGYTLHTDVGAGTNFYYYATETKDEYGSGGFVVSNVAAGAVWLIRQNGALIKTTDEGDGKRTYAGGRSFAGAACWHEWDFEQGGKDEYTNKLEDSGSFSTNTPPTGVTLSATGGDSSLDYEFYNVPVQGEDKCCISYATHPNAEISFGDTWSTAVRCTMPTVTGDGKAVAISFGDTDNGILGLAAGAGGIVEMFNWTNGVYTTLAKVQVESATDAMHIYVFAVTNDTTAAKRYVSFYRDGEFIHRAAFALKEGGAITQFKVGAVNGAGANLPDSSDSGYVDYIRLYDKVIPESDIEGLSTRRPFVSAYKTYVREVNTATSWKLDGEWINSTNSAVRVANPEDGTHVVLVGAAGDAESETQLTVNLDEPSAYGTLIFNGGSRFLLVPENGTKRISAGMVVVRTPTVVQYGTVDFTHAMVGVDEGASLTFDLARYPFENVLVETNVYITGEVVARSYDPGVDSRISVINKPSHTWAVTDLQYDDDNKGYFVTITPNHNAGTEIYYGSGYITAGMDSIGSENIGTVFLNSDLTGVTTLLEGDIVVVGGSGSKNAWISDEFNGNLRVSCDTLNLMPGAQNDGILSSRTVTVDSGKTLNLKAHTDTDLTRTFNFGALTLVGPGSINFVDDARATSIASNATINVASGKTLTLDSNAGNFTGSVTGSGTVLLRRISGSIQFSNYGNANSIIAVGEDGMNAWIKSNGDQAASVISTLRLDGNITISALSNWTYTLSTITGDGDLTIPNSASPKSFTISNVEGYDGTIINNHATVTVRVGRVTLETDVKGGTRILKKTGNVVVDAVRVNGVDSAMELYYGDDGVYKASAEFGGDKYKTVDEAISAAIAAGANLNTITVYDPTADIAGEYGIVEVEGEPPTYTVAEKANTYLWVGQPMESWSTLGNWRYGDNSAATRLPGVNDTVVFDSQYVMPTIPTSTRVAAIIVRSGNCMFNVLDGYSLSLGTVTAKDGLLQVMVREGATFTYNEELGPFTKVNIEDGPTKTYTFQLRPGTIFSVY